MLSRSEEKLIGVSPAATSSAQPQEQSVAPPVVSVYDPSKPRLLLMGMKK